MLELVRIGDFITNSFKDLVVKNLSKQTITLVAKEKKLERFHSSRHVRAFF